MQNTESAVQLKFEMVIYKVTFSISIGTNISYDYFFIINL